MFEKHRWKSDILSKDAGENVTPPQLFFKHFASKSQLPGLSISGTLAFFKKSVPVTRHLMENDIEKLYTVLGQAWMPKSLYRVI